MLGDSAPLSPTALFMTAVAGVAKARGAALTLFGTAFEELLCATSDARTKAVQDLEFVCREGPTLTSAVEGRMVAATDKELDTDWPAFGSAATVLGVHRLVAVPVVLPGSASATLTVLDPPLVGGATDFPRLRELADALFHLVLPDVRREMGDWSQLTDAGRRSLVHQATGVIAEQLGCGLEDASALLRARAYASGESLDELARAVIGRRTRFERP
jgi:hypothetical protein